ncbi:MAG: hypothetical protein KJ626_07720 [Verrucomicrobia bacterium]|nr:hypothetical protein [Verrucomicrobiota bacterium]
MKTHEEIDNRSLALARAVVQKIDADPERLGLERARHVCRRWLERGSSSACREWLTILSQSWPEIREVLLDESERGKRLRQSNPFCGIISPRERWQLYRTWSHHEAR